MTTQTLLVKLLCSVLLTVSLAAAAEESDYVVELADGSRVVGKLQAQHPADLQLESKSMGLVLTIPKANIVRFYKATSLSAAIQTQQHPTSAPAPAPIVNSPGSGLALSINAPESVTDGTQSKIDVGGSAQVMLRQPDLCAPASVFTHFGLYGDHSRAYKAHSTSAAVTTNTFDGQASVSNSVANSPTTTVYGIVDYWANSSLGIAFQQAYGAGVSHMFYSSYCPTLNDKRRFDFYVSGKVDVRGLKERLDKGGSTDVLVGMRPDFNLVVSPLSKAKDGSVKPILSVDLEGWVLPVFNLSKAFQAGGQLNVKVPVNQVFSLTLSEEDDYVGNAPLANRKNYLKSSVTLNYSFPPSATK
jgi:hypothetical protein